MRSPVTLPVAVPGLSWPKAVALEKRLSTAALSGLGGTGYDHRPPNRDPQTGACHGKALDAWKFRS
jgi:hypothetical protein